MYKLDLTKRFRKDCKKNKIDINNNQKLKTAFNCLVSGKPLPPNYRDHKLNDDQFYKNCREFHLDYDIVVVYKIHKNKLIVEAIRLGTHKDVLHCASEL